MLVEQTAIAHYLSIC